MARIARGVLVAAGLACLPTVLMANGIVRDSIGAISSGRGGANVAHSDNLSIINDNPAGLAWMEERFRVEFANDFLYDDVGYRDSDDSDSSRENFFYLPEVSVAGRIPDTSVTLGLAAYFPGGYGARYKLRHDIFGRQTYESDGMLLKIMPSAAMKIGEHVSVGAGVGLGYTSASFGLPYTFNQTAFAGQSALVDLDADGYAVTGNVGIQVRPTDRWTIGAAYISQTKSSMEGDFDIDVTGSPLAGLVADPTASYDADLRLRWPQSATLGTSYTFDWGRISTEVAWFDWSDAFDELHIRLSDGDNPEFDALAGNTPTETFPLNWRDSYTIRFGYEHFFSFGTARGGYVYNLNPIPNRTLTLLLPGNLQHTLSVGWGFDFGSFELDLAYQYAWGEKQKVAISDLAGDDFDNSSVRAQAHWFFLNLTGKF